MSTLDKDTRMLRRNLAKGFLSTGDYQDILNGVPDSADNAEYIDLDALAAEGKEDAGAAEGDE